MGGKKQKRERKKKGEWREKKRGDPYRGGRWKPKLESIGLPRQSWLVRNDGRVPISPGQELG